MLSRLLLSILPIAGIVLSASQGTSNNATTYDYIIVGSGPAGIVMADRLSETGKKVLLIERGGPSTAATGGTDVPPWASATHLTRFDIPAIYQSMYAFTGQYWWCNDITTRAGCLVGGGTAINGILYWYPTDFEYSTSNGWPNGWQSVSPYLNKVRARLPSTDNPSEDGKRYLNEVYDVMGSILKKQGYKAIVANDQRNNKDHVYTHTNYYIQDGKRTGPMDTYLQTAKSRSNFKLVTYTNVIAVVRKGGQITGVQTNNTSAGSNGVYTLTQKGRVILSGGVFGTARILFQSGIGPKDMLDLAAANSTVSKYMPPASDYIDLPVGINVTDNPGISVTFTHPSVDSYDNWNDTFNQVRPADAQLYISKRSGPLTAPSAHANFWRAYQGADGGKRYVQGTCRPGGTLPPGSSANISNLWSCSMYVGTGLKSVGRIGINSALQGVILKSPSLTNAEDKAVLIQGLKDYLSTYQQVSGLTLITPNSTTSPETHVTNTVGGSNHWVGSTRMGTSPSNSVLDSNTKVWNTKNLYVVDAGTYCGVATGNPMGSFLVMAEMAADRMKKLPGGY
ncbi:hypothetical protein FRC09_006799 [Ceratobasidium sp. 395]|nr:hypothetical protein FRC09_006799 [Ceratobasidium sp. 395]